MMEGLSDAERHVIAASYHLLKAVQSINLSNDVRRLLGDLDNHLSSMIQDESEDNNRAIEARLLSSRHVIINSHSCHSKIWGSNPATVLEYLQAVGEVQRLIATLENMSLKRSGRTRGLFDCAQTTMQMAMDRMQSELIHILFQNKQCFERESVCLLPVCEEESVISNEDESIENASQRDRSSTETEDYAMDLIHPDVVPQIKSIGDIMFTSGYGQEFCQAFTGFWRCAFSEYLTNLEVERISVEDVLHMEWKSLNSRIRKWRGAMRSAIGVYLASAKRLFDQVLGGYGHISASCLIDASRAPVLSLLNFGQAVSIGPHRPEWLYCLLDMYEVLTALTPDVDALFPQEMGSLIRSEFHELLTRLGDSVKAIFEELGNHIATSSSATPFTSGGIPHLTKYVVNYILCFAEYGDTLNLLLQDGEKMDGGRSVDVGSNPSCAVAFHLQLLTSTLEANIENRSSLYKDCALKHIFMMNNIHYMVQKIKDSKIRPYFGDDWIRNHVVKYRQHAMWYERVTWGSTLALLRNDGKTGKATLKARCRDFTAAFEEIYKNQTKWLVPDHRLREEVRISASKTVIQAYRNFVKNVTDHIGEKHIKYTEHELEIYILDLLDGSSKSLNHSRKR